MTTLAITKAIKVLKSHKIIPTYVTVRDEQHKAKKFCTVNFASTNVIVLPFSNR